jgi:hypothetical protein
MSGDLFEPRVDTSVPRPALIPGLAPRRARVWAAAITAGVVAIGLTWGAGEASIGRFQPEATGRPELGPQHGFISPEAEHRAVLKNAALAYGLQGAILAALLGVAGAAARGSVGAAVKAGFAGLLLGAGLGAAVSYAAFTLVARWAGFGSQEMLPDLLGHVASWSVVGASGGAAFGWGLGGRARVARAAAGGLIGAAVAAAVYEVTGGMMFPFDRTGDPVAESGVARLFAHALVDSFAALGAAAFSVAAGPKWK